jgi:hypothetical protein
VKSTKSRGKRSSSLKTMAAELKRMRRDLDLLAMQGKLDELMIRVARLEADRHND